MPHEFHTHRPNHQLLHLNPPRTHGSYRRAPPRPPHCRRGALRHRHRLPRKQELPRLELGRRGLQLRRRRNLGHLPIPRHPLGLRHGHLLPPLQEVAAQGHPRLRQADPRLLPRSRPGNRHARPPTAIHVGRIRELPHRPRPVGSHHARRPHRPRQLRRHRRLRLCRFRQPRAADHHHVDAPPPLRHRILPPC